MIVALVAAAVAVPSVRGAIKRKAGCRWTLVLVAALLLQSACIISVCVDAAFSTPSLADDYAAAQQRRAFHEEVLLRRLGGPVQLPYFVGEGQSTGRKGDNNNNNNDRDENKRKRSRNRIGSGGGFGAVTVTSGRNPSKKMTNVFQQPKAPTRAQRQVALSMASALQRDGVIRLPGCLTKESCTALRRHVLHIQAQVADLAQRTNNPSSPQRPFDPTEYYGVEPGRTSRTDLLLPLDDIVQGALSQLLQPSNPLRHLFCEVCSLESPLYEIAAVITDNGSHRQMIHPDLPFQQECPLYVAFVALQDVTADMGPTTFLRGTQTKDYNLVVDVDDDFLKGADVVVSTLNAGDAVVFDARILHCGNANESSQSRALLNFSFKRPDSGHLGYEGSIRKGYVDKTSLGELLQVADSLNGWVGGGDGDFAGSDGTKTLESVYGDGLTR